MKLFECFLSENVFITKRKKRQRCKAIATHWDGCLLSFERVPPSKETLRD